MKPNLSSLSPTNIEVHTVPKGSIPRRDRHIVSLFDVVSKGSQRETHQLRVPLKGRTQIGGPTMKGEGLCCDSQPHGILWLNLFGRSSQTLPA